MREFGFPAGGEEIGICSGHDGLFGVNMLYSTRDVGSLGLQRMIVVGTSEGRKARTGKAEEEGWKEEGKPPGGGSAKERRRRHGEEGAWYPSDSLYHHLVSRRRRVISYD